MRERLFSLQVEQVILIFLPIRESYYAQLRWNAEGIYLAKAIDGVYDSDPKLNPAAKKYDEVSIQEVIDQKLAVVDLTASIYVHGKQDADVCVRIK